MYGEFVRTFFERKLLRVEIIGRFRGSAGTGKKMRTCSSQQRINRLIALLLIPKRYLGMYKYICISSSISVCVYFFIF